MLGGRRDASPINPRSNGAGRSTLKRMRRRVFLQSSGAMALALLAGCSLPSPVPRETARPDRIGFLGGSLPNATNDLLMSAFRQGLLDLGYVEGRDVEIDSRHANGDDQVAEPAADLIRLQARVIVVTNVTIARAVQTLSTTIPIVNAGSGDLVERGLAVSLARPGGNVTGMSTPSLTFKQLELLQETAPGISKVMVLFDTSSALRREELETAGHALSIQPYFAGARVPDELEPAFDAAIREGSDALFVLNGPLTQANLGRIADLALQRTLPSMWNQGDAVVRGGLMTYTANRSDLYRRSASFVDRILKGASPAELPIERPSVFDFAVNMKTAQGLGLTIPPTVLAQATEVIQ